MKTWFTNKIFTGSNSGLHDISLRGNSAKTVESSSCHLHTPNNRGKEVLIRYTKIDSQVFNSFII